MSFLVSPELAKVALREGLEMPFTVWSILRDSVVAENLSSHFTKKRAIEICTSQGLSFTSRHWRNIWQAGKGIFWGIDNRQIFIRSIRRVALRFEGFRKACDQELPRQNFFVQISLSGGIEDLRSKLYWSWFAQFDEKTISRETLTDLFGLSPDQQRAYEKSLGAALLVKTNYAHVSDAMYQDKPQELPEYHFTIRYEREVSLNQDAGAGAGYQMQETIAYQYQLPNTFISRHEGRIAIPVPFASNRAREAVKYLNRQTDSLLPNKRIYWLNRAKFERMGTLDSYVRSYYQGKKRLWIGGNYF